MKNAVRYLCVCCILMMSGGGCASWQNGSSKTTQLPAPRIPTDSVLVDVVFVKLPVDAETIEKALWSEVDEQHLPVELRRNLAENGLRCGLVGSQLPPALVEMIRQQEIAARARGVEGVALIDKSVPQRRQIPSRAGYRNEIVASTSSQPTVILVRQDDQVRGKTYPNSECKFALKTFPLGDGRVRMQLTPEIHFGEVRQRWIGRQGAFRLDAGREKKIFADLQLQAVLSPGQTLLLSCTPEIKGLGQQFLSDISSDGVRRKLIMLRLAQTQYDNLFAPEKTLNLLATPSH